jgi:WD40 repeat protein
VLSVAFSPDGKLLASGTSDKTILLWNVSRGETIATLNGQGDSNFLFSVVFSPHGKTLAGVCGKSIILWDLQ